MSSSDDDDDSNDLYSVPSSRRLRAIRAAEAARRPVAAPPVVAAAAAITASGEMAAVAAAAAGLTRTTNIDGAAPKRSGSTKLRPSTTTATAVKPSKPKPTTATKTTSRNDFKIAAAMKPSKPKPFTATTASAARKPSKVTAAANSLPPVATTRTPMTTADMAESINEDDSLLDEERKMPALALAVPLKVMAAESLSVAATTATGEPPPPVATKRKRGEENQPRTKIDRHAKITKMDLVQFCTTDGQRACLKQYDHSHNLYGTIKSGTATEGYYVAMDCFSQEQVFIQRKKLVALRDGDQEPEYDGLAAERKCSKSTTTTTMNDLELAATAGVSAAAFDNHHSAAENTSTANGITGMDVDAPTNNTNNGAFDEFTDTTSALPSPAPAAVATLTAPAIPQTNKAQAEEAALDPLLTVNMESHKRARAHALAERTIEESPPLPTRLSPQQKGRLAPVAASGHTKQKKRQPPVKKGSRVKAKRSLLFHVLPTELQQYLPPEEPNYHNYYGTVLKKSRARKPAYDIKFDAFCNNEVAKGIRRKLFTTVKKGEEPLIDEKYLASEERERAIQDEDIKDPLEAVSEQDFCCLGNEVLQQAKKFTHKFNNRKCPQIEWTILGAGEHIDNDDTFIGLKEKLSSGPTLHPDVSVGMEDLSNGQFFLKYIWPDMTGFGKKMDEYYTSSKANYYNTVQDRHIIFHDPTNDDPDWKMKQAVLLIVHGVNVNGTGVEQFWRSGKLEGDLEGADFGQYFDINEFRALVAALPFMWADKNYWYRDPRDIPWEIFMPFIDKWNSKQQQLFAKYGCIIVDESFISWVPKTSKLGGLPNYSFEPRKPKGLGTMLRDAAIAVIGVIVYTDPAMPPSVQDKKKFGEKSSQSPEFAGTNTPHSPHVAETLRQAYFSNLQEGDWIGGDSFFGSIATCLALKLEEVTHIDEEGAEHQHKMNVESSFIVKNKSSLFPRAPLYAVLRARYGKRIAGQWVVFKTTIQSVNILAIAYAWSDISYIVSTVGNTTAAKDPYVSLNPKTGFDGGDTKQLPRPDIANFLMAHLSTIDTFNKQRQFTLQVEEQWPTKHCWTKLLNGYIGKSVVNQQMLFSYFYPGIPGKDLSCCNMAASISAALVKRVRTVLPAGLQQAVGDITLKRVADNTGNARKHVTGQQRGKRTYGSSKQQTCYVCRKYKKKYSYAVGKCPRCGTCLCLSMRYDGRPLSCLEEHLTSKDPNVCCNGVKKTRFPASSRTPNWE